MKHEELPAEMKAVAEHMSTFSAGLADLIMSFIKPIDVTEDQDAYDFVRKVLGKADELMAVVMMQDDNPEAMQMLKESTDRVMAAIVERRTEGKTKH